MQRVALVSLIALASIGSMGCARTHAGARGGTSGSDRAQQQEASCGATVVDCLPFGAVEIAVADLAAARITSASRQLLAAVAPEDPAAFERTFGFPLEAVRSIAFGRYEPGELYVIEGDFDAREVVEHLGDRMNTLELSDAAPPRRVGFVGVERVDAARVGADRLALAREHGAPMMRLLGRLARGRGPSTTERMPSPLTASLHAAPIALAVYMPGRFDPATDVGLLFARTEWVAATVRGLGETELELAVTVHGTLPASAGQNLGSLVGAVAQSELGGVFGIRGGLQTLTVTAASDGARVGMRLDARQVASALRMVLPRRRAALSRE